MAIPAMRTLAQTEAAAEATRAGQGFVPWSAEHVGALVGCAVAVAVVVAGGWAWRATPAGETLRRTLGWAAMGYQVAFGTVWWLLPENYDPATSLPLHLCDIAGYVAPVAIVTQHRGLRAVLCFWAFAMSSQAYVTPTLLHGPEHARFWLFWIGHTMIVGLAVYDAAVLGFRPKLRDLRTGIWAGVAYAGVVTVFNGITGFNYGYLGPTLPETRTLVHALGPWPFRAGAITAVGVAAMSVVWILFAVARTLTKEK